METQYYLLELPFETGTNTKIKDIRIWVDKDGSNPTDDLKIILDELDLKGKIRS